MSIKRQFLWNMAPLLVVTLLNLVSVPLFVHTLGKDLYALWAYVLTFSGVFGFADLGLGVAVGRYVGVALGRGDQQAAREYWGTGNLIALPLLGLMGLAFAGIGVSLGPSVVNIAPENQSLLRWCFVAGGVGLFCGFYGQFWNILLHAQLDFRFSGLMRTGISLLQIVPSLGLAYLTHNPFLLVAWSSAVGLVQIFVSIWYCHRRYGLGLDLKTARLARAREMASYTGKTFVALITGSFQGNIDRLVLGKLAAPADFAHYTIASNAGTRIQNLGVSVMGPVFYNTSRTVEGQGASTPATVYDQTFDFTFGWYLLLTVWTAVWHPVLLRLWLGSESGSQVGLVFAPLVAAFCLTAIANISNAQLSALNRVGTAVGFSIAAGLLTAAGVFVGWHLAGIRGVAFGFLASRIAFLAQDLFTIRLLKAGGWLASRTWLRVLVQSLVGAAFASAYLVWPRHSYWLLLPALLHGLTVAAWLLRQPLRRILANATGCRVSPSALPEGSPRL